MNNLLKLCAVGVFLVACDTPPQTSDQVQRSQQERILSEGTSQVGMPAIKNFRERKLVKDLFELRDQDGLTTFTYVFNEMKGCFVFIGDTIGYGIPYATQFTSPLKMEGSYQSYVGMPQADPNGLFSPDAAEGTWIMMKDPAGPNVKPVYIESRVTVSPFALSPNVVCKQKE
jgi:hypothetical protein